MTAHGGEGQVRVLGRVTQPGIHALRIRTILTIDNDDSFTYNLVQRLGAIDAG